MVKRREFVDVVAFEPSRVFEKEGRTIFDFSDGGEFVLEIDSIAWVFEHVLNSTQEHISYINGFCFEDVELVFRHFDRYKAIHLIDLHNEIVNHPDYTVCVNRLLSKTTRDKHKEFFDKLELGYEELLDTEGGRTMVSPVELDFIMKDIEIMNGDKYKEAAINVALDTGNKELFMKITGGNIND